jgi:hypothetical protein
MTDPYDGTIGDELSPRDDMSVEMLAAALRQDAAELATYAQVLTGSLTEALPPDTVAIERRQSMSDRLKGRPGDVVAIQVRLGDRVLGLHGTGQRITAEIQKEVRGVILSRQQVGLDVWLDELAKAISAAAASSARSREALGRFLRGS